MPRDGSNIYHRPPGTDAVPDTTIESTKYNSNVADVEQDLNAPRPIVAGGTGAANAADALTNLSAEMEGQIVTNYDSNVFVSGSFYSASGATNPPVAGHAFVGYCYSSDPLPTPPTAPLNQNMVIEARDQNDTVVPGLRYIREKKAGVWSLWKVDVGSTAVRYDAPQGLTTAQQVQARQNVYAAPFDALAYSGMQINGSMDVSQQNGTTPVPSGYVLDGWQVYKQGTVVMYNVQQPSSLPGIINNILAIPATAQAALAATDVVMLYQNMEGYRTSRLGWGTASAQPITIGFWSRHTRTGTYSVKVGNQANDRVCLVPYTQNVSDVWEYKTVAIPGCTDGVWKTDNTVGMLLSFTIAAGSSQVAPSNGVWLSSAYAAVAGQVNSVSTLSDAFRITGVVVLPGIEAPSAARAPLIMRPYDQELVTCQRYWRKSYDQGVNPGSTAPGGSIEYCTGNTGANVYRTSVPFSPIMRASPTSTIYDLAGTAGKITTLDVAANATHGQTINMNVASSSMLNVGVAAITGAAGFRCHYTMDARL
jgi:hypothetical protein